MTSSAASDLRATFTTMETSTAEDWAIIRAHFVDYARALPDRILSHLAMLEGDCGGFAVDRLTHSLQRRTTDPRVGRDGEYVVCAPLHEIGEALGTYTQPDVAAAILKPFVSPENYWMVEKHGVFQGYYFFQRLGIVRNLREKFRGHQWFDPTAEFCSKYDGLAFDPKAETLPLHYFEPMVRRVLAVPRDSLYMAYSERKAG